MNGSSVKRHFILYSPGTVQLIRENSREIFVGKLKKTAATAAIHRTLNPVCPEVTFGISESDTHCRNFPQRR